ncbi:SDR family oxidoreductase [Methylobacterium dankookense]|uniref:Glucose 1-dehydrogenase 2 n=1 Tax=Methylobacterium dankookense TaxID=560405 RepID=A0A564G1N1_9HYPH|nr:SDR family oxidoreductase [Methylobacterium dankookense]GJD56652.1 putative oxidoreductase YgfF [Methylobacterium dankookense]VUF14335.1 Glucose 1-dehydrogenase 2 [Methylobacterium dankookense]
MPEIADKVAVVTGGSRGIGRAVAMLAARRGWRVCLSYVSDAAAAEAVVAAIADAGGQACAVRADVGAEADVEALFAAADRLGTVAGLVNNAGVVDVAARVEAMGAERLHRMMRVNVVGSLLCAREAVRRMSTRNGGRGGAIVNLSSVAARLGGAGQYVDYAAAKGAIDTFTLGLAREVAEEGIRVNAVAPGIIDTEIHASGGQPDRAWALASQIPMKRPGTADEIAAPVVWLLSDEAAYTTGAVLQVTGGR